MLPGNINDRIATFANKHEGFDRHLFLKTGEYRGENSMLTKEPMIGTRHRWTQIFEQRATKGMKTFTRIARIDTNFLSPPYPVTSDPLTRFRVGAQLGAASRKKALPLAGLIGTNTLFVPAEPGIWDQFVPRPSASGLVCICKIQPR